MEEMENTKDVVLEDGSTTSGSEGTEGKKKQFSDRLQEAWGPALNRSVGKAGKVSWGLVILGVVAVYAVYKLVRAILFFF